MPKQWEERCWINKTRSRITITKKKKLSKWVGGILFLYSGKEVRYIEYIFHYIRKGMFFYSHYVKSSRVGDRESFWSAAFFMYSYYFTFFLRINIEKITKKLFFFFYFINKNINSPGTFVCLFCVLTRMIVQLCIGF